MGVNHSTKGTETVNAINNLALITGNIGRSGASPFSITGQCNAMGTREAGFTSSLPGYRKFESRKDREELARLWNIDESRIPAKRGLAYPDIIEAAVAKKIRALWIIAHESAGFVSQIDVLKQGSRQSGFSGGAGWFSSDADNGARRSGFARRHLGRKGRNLHQLRTARQQSESGRRAAGRSAQRLRYFSRASRRSLAAAKRLFPDGGTVEDAFNEWRRVSAGRLCDYSGISYAMLAEKRRNPVAISTRAELPQRARLYADGKFQTADGRAKLDLRGWAPFPGAAQQEYPLILNTGRTVEHWHTRTKTRRSRFCSACRRGHGWR